MMIRKHKWLAFTVVASVVAVTTALALPHAGASATSAPACRGGGRQHGGGSQDGHSEDMAAIHFLFAHREAISRTVTEIPGGVRTLTEAEDPAVVAGLRSHVEAMYARLKEGRPIHARDPLFAALFRNAERIDVRIEKTAKGLRVSETSADAEVVKLLRKHAEVVSLFLANGMPEMMRNH
jgi:hypothetical protein